MTDGAHDIRFPAIPEIGVDGESVAFGPERIVATL